MAIYCRLCLWLLVMRRDIKGLHPWLFWSPPEPRRRGARKPRHPAQSRVVGMGHMGTLRRRRLLVGAMMETEASTPSAVSPVRR